MRRWIRRFGAHQGGATAIEYAIVAAGISIVVLVAVQTIGTNVNAVFGQVASYLK